MHDGALNPTSRVAVIKTISTCVDLRIRERDFTSLLRALRKSRGESIEINSADQKRGRTNRNFE